VAFVFSFGVLIEETTVRLWDVVKFKEGKSNNMWTVVVM